MSQQELLARVVRVLEDLGIEYLLTGSMVSSMQGEPRATHDIDLVVSLPPESVHDLVRAFPEPDYYLDEESVRGALARRDSFNLIDLGSGDKVDFWLLTDDPFDRSRFARRVAQQMLGLALQVSRPEDTILQKLRWSQMAGGSEKHFGDALSVYEVQHASIDQAYLDRWAGQLGVTDLLKRLRQEAEPL